MTTNKDSWDVHMTTEVKMRHVNDSEKAIPDHYRKSNDTVRLAFKVGYQYGAAAEIDRLQNSNPQ